MVDIMLLYCSYLVFKWLKQCLSWCQLCVKIEVLSLEPPLCKIERCNYRKPHISKKQTPHTLYIYRESAYLGILSVTYNIMYRSEAISDLIHQR